jgi:HrpA-like RNA helicase
LPIYACREELLDILRENRVMIVVGETGSGVSFCSESLLLRAVVTAVLRYVRKRHN